MKISNKTNKQNDVWSKTITDGESDKKINIDNLKMFRLLGGMPTVTLDQNDDDEVNVLDIVPAFNNGNKHLIQLIVDQILGREVVLPANGNNIGANYSNTASEIDDVEYNQGDVVELEDGTDLYEKIITDINNNERNVVYKLKKNCTYYISKKIKVGEELNKKLVIIGEEFENNSANVPPIIMPKRTQDSDGNFTYQIDGWPGMMISIGNSFSDDELNNFERNTDFVMSGCEFMMRNVYCHGISSYGDVAFGVLATYGENNKIIFDNVIMSDFGIVDIMNFGRSDTIKITNVVAKHKASGFGNWGFGGFLWGGGNWLGTIDRLFVQNCSFVNLVGEAFVLYNEKSEPLLNDEGDLVVDSDGNQLNQKIYGIKNGAIIDHCTFYNNNLEPFWQDLANNLTVSNCIFKNQLLRPCTIDILGGSDVFIYPRENQGIIMISHKEQDITNGIEEPQFSYYKNVVFKNNMGHNDQLNFEIPDGAVPLIEITDSEGNKYIDHQGDNYTNPMKPYTIINEDGSSENRRHKITYQANNILSLDVIENNDDDEDLSFTNMQKLIDDGVIEVSNTIYEDPQINNFDYNYTKEMIHRILDVKDDDITNVEDHTTNFWQHKPNLPSLQDFFTPVWPMDIDLSYDDSSPAASHSDNAGKIGDLNWHNGGKWKE